VISNCTNRLVVGVAAAHAEPEAAGLSLIRLQCVSPWA